MMETVLIVGPQVVSWVHDHPGYVTLLMATVALLDTVPGLGHMLAKPLQYALPWIFGYPLGAVMIGICLYSSLTLQFIFGRYLLHDCVRGRIGRMKLFMAIDRALSKDRGLLLVCLLRANILMPEILTSYVLSVTRLSAFNYCVGSVVECAKNVPMQLYIAYTIDTGSKAMAAGGEEARATLVRLCVGGAVAVGTLLAVAHLVSRELKRHGINEPAVVASILPTRRQATISRRRSADNTASRSERCWRAAWRQLRWSVEHPDEPVLPEGSPSRVVNVDSPAANRNRGLAALLAGEGGQKSERPPAAYSTGTLTH
jgi:uncharacterized membrane protein YdjX (TVP38/TMEM64 family)